MSVFIRGAEAIERGMQEDAAARVRREQLRNKVDEIYLDKDGETTRVLILDDDATSYYRHMLPNAYGGYDPYTCLTEKGACPLCAAGKSRSYVTLFTVVALDRIIKSTKTPGKEYRFQRYVMVAKSDERNRLNLLRKDNGGTLKLAVLRLHRAPGSKKALGESIDFVQRVDINWVKANLVPALVKTLPAYAHDNKTPTVQEWLTPVDYDAAYPLLEPAKLAAVAGVPYKGGASQSIIAPDDLGLNLGGGGLGSSPDDFNLDAGFAVPGTPAGNTPPTTTDVDLIL